MASFADLASIRIILSSQTLRRFETPFFLFEIEKVILQHTAIYLFLHSFLKSSGDMIMARKIRKTIKKLLLISYRRLLEILQP
jgi:hypothetical protein